MEINNTIGATVVHFGRLKYKVIALQTPLPLQTVAKVKAVLPGPTKYGPSTVYHCDVLIHIMSRSNLGRKQLKIYCDRERLVPERERKELRSGKLNTRLYVGTLFL